MNWAWGQKLAPTAKLILMALADAADDQGICWPSVPTVTNKCSVSTRTVRRVMQAIVADGLLQSEPRYRKDGSCSSNRYWLLLEGGDKLSPPPDRGDSTCGHGCQGDPDTSVIPRTTIRTIKETPQPQEMPTGSVASGSVESGGGCFSDLEYPKGLSAAERKEAEKKLAGFPSGLAQQLLDELAASILAGSIRVTPLAYLRGLIKRAQTSGFTPEAGLRIAEHRKRRIAIEAAASSHSEALGRIDSCVVNNPLVNKLVALRRKAQEAGQSEI
jgi:hypothetical protein